MPPAMGRGPCRDRRLAVLLGEDQRVERLGPVAAPRLGGDEPLGRHDLPIHAAHRPSRCRRHLRQTNRHAPPGRRSISQTGMVQPAGPSIQCGRCSGLGPGLPDEPARRVEDARHDDLPIRRRRERRGTDPICRRHDSSPFLSGVGGTRSRRSKLSSQKRRIVLGPLGDLLERRRLEPARAPLRLAASGDQAGALEHPEVLRDGRAAHRERRRKLLDRGRALGEAGEDRPARGVGEGREVMLRVSVAMLYLTTRLSNR